MAKGVATMKVSESFETVLKNRDLKLDKKDLGMVVSRFLVCIQKEKPSFHLASCLMIARTVPITRLLMKESGMEETLA